MKVLIVVARRYNGHELWTTLGMLQEAGHEFEVVSTATMIQDEVTHKRNTIVRTLDDLRADEMSHWDGLMVISGNMKDTESYWRDERVLRLVREMQERPLAAICCSVPTIREVARDKRVSFFPLVRSRLLLEEAGAKLSSVSITQDGNLVTAEHQMSSQVWAQTFIEVLETGTSSLALTDSGFVPKGKTRRRLPARLEQLVYDETELERLRQLDIERGKIRE